MRAFLIAMTMLFSLNAHAADRYDGIPDKFLATYQSGKPVEAVDYLIKTSPYAKELGEQTRSLREVVKTYQNTMGKYNGAEQVSERAVGTHYVNLMYVMSYERQPVLLELSLYRYKDKWVLQNVYFNATFSDDISREAKAALGK